MHAAIQEIKQARHEDLTDAGTAEGQRVRAQEDRGTRLIRPKRFALADRVTPEEVQLQLPDVGFWDRDVREFPKSRRDSVRDRALRDRSLQRPPVCLDAAGRRGPEPDALSSAGGGRGNSPIPPTAPQGEPATNAPGIPWPPIIFVPG